MSAIGAQKSVVRRTASETEGGPHGLANDIVVDVGIPTLGESPYLREAVESVMRQTLSAWRLVISENGPGSELVREILEPYRDDPRVYHLVTGTRVGRGQNHTNLIRFGDAPYVAVLHDDDRWATTFLEEHVKFLDANESCGLVFSGHHVIDSRGQSKGRKKLILNEGVYPPSRTLPLLYRKNFIGVPTVVVRRTAYERVGAEYKEVTSCDHEMWLRLAAHFDIGCIESWDADYRIHEAQTSARRTELAREEFEVFKAVDDLPIPASVRRKVHAESHVRCALDAAERGERHESLRHLSDAVRTHPVCVFRPSVAGRSFVTLATLAGGRRARRALTAVRSRRWESGGGEGLLDPLQGD